MLGFVHAAQVTHGAQAEGGDRGFVLGAEAGECGGAEDQACAHVAAELRGPAAEVTQVRGGL